jgi:protein gp37
MSKDSASARLAKGVYWEPWNWVFGCTPMGAGCKNCWAREWHYRRRNASRLKHNLYQQPFEDVQVFPDRLEIPLHVRKPTRYAMNLSGDSLHEKVPFEILDQAFAVAALCPQHTIIVLTKRWERMAEYWNSPGDGPLGSHNACDRIDHRANSITYPQRVGLRFPLPNVWLGVSVSTQVELDAAVPHLLATPAAVRLLSLEPLLEGLDLRLCPHPDDLVASERDPEEDSPVAGDACPSGRHWVNMFCDEYRARNCGIGGLIIGCESGPKRRPCKIEWIESIVEQGKPAGVPVFVKQVNINGRVSKDPSEWPESIRVRELPG